MRAMRKAYLWFALGLYLAFGINHAIDVFVLEHHEPGIDAAAFYRTLLGIGVPIALVAAIVFLVGLRTLRFPGMRPISRRGSGAPSPRGPTWSPSAPCCS